MLLELYKTRTAVYQNDAARTIIRPVKAFSPTGASRGSHGFFVAISVVVLLACTSSAQLTLQQGAVVKKSAAASRGADLVYALLAGEFALRRADLDTALGYYLDATRLTDDPEVLRGAFKLALHNKDYGTAVRLGQRWRVLQPGNLELGQMLAVTYLLDRRFEDAMRALEDVVGREGINDSRLFTTFGATLLSEMPAEARERMREMADKFSDNARAQYVYAVFLIDTGDYARVVERAAKAAGLDPGFANAYLLQGWALIRDGRVGEGLAAAAAGVAAAPDDVMARGNYARLLLENDRQAEALREFRLVHDHRPHDPDVIQAIGVLSMQQGDFADAEIFFDRLGAFPGRGVEAGYYRGRVAEERGEMQKALDSYRAVPRGEFFKKAQLSIVEVYRKLGEHEKATEQLETVRALAESEQEKVEFYLVHGKVLSDAGRHGEAIDLYTRAMREHGELSELLYARGLAAAELDLLGRFEADLRRILEDEPENADVLNALGYVFADHNVRLQEAKAYILRAYRLQPDNPAILDSMGWVEFRLRNVEAAESFVRRAMAGMRHPEVLGHLVEILCFLRRTGEVAVLLEQGLLEFPDSDYLRRLRGGC